MSEFNVEVFRIEKISSHDNADNLEIAHYYGYPVIVRKGQFHVGDLAIYIPIDAIVPVNTEYFGFLKTDELHVQQRIKAKRLRGVYSQGLIIPNIDGFANGENVQLQLGITKWEPQLVFESALKGRQFDEASPPKCYVPVYDLEGYRKLPNAFDKTEIVIVTEKLHGTNARFTYVDGQFYVGSHRRWLKETENNVWWKMARAYNLEYACRQYEGTVFYGEIFGKGVQKHFDYGTSEPELAIFDMYNTYSSQYYAYYAMQDVCEAFSLQHVPCLYVGVLAEEILQLRNAMSTFACKNGLTSHIAEGIVIESFERTHFETLHMQRAKLKFVGEEYLLRK